MATTSEAIACFHTELDRIEGERRQPSDPEDRALRQAWIYLRATPDLAMDILRTLRFLQRAPAKTRLAPAARTIHEWRQDLRVLSH